MENDRHKKIETDNKFEYDQLFFEKLDENSLPQIMTFKDVSVMLQVSLASVYRWSSLGYFDSCKVKLGGGLVRIHRNLLLKELFLGPLVKKGLKNGKKREN